MRVLRGKKESTMTRVELQELASSFDGIDIDVGTGDGRFVLDRASSQPDRLIIGLDPVAGAMEQSANRAVRPRTKLDNALFVIASVEQMPVELNGLCDAVYINLPWGSLMRGVILGQAEILKPLARIGAPCAIYRIILNLRVFDDPIPLDVRNLPEVTSEYVRNHLEDLYAAAGLRICRVGAIPGHELTVLDTTWARRLSHQQPPPSLRIEAFLQRNYIDSH